MKKLCVGLLAVGLLAFTGCNTSGTGGGPETGGTFTITGPSNTPETRVKQGETKSVEISVNRKGGFKEDITFSATLKDTDKGKGVTLSFDPETLKGSETNKVTLNIKAADDAAVGEYTATVVAKPTKGTSPDVDVKFKVEKK
jgi:uncharacterized membrane protein